MNDRLFSLVCSLLCNGYGIRVGYPGDGWSDFTEGTEEEVWKCYNEIHASEETYLWVFGKGVLQSAAYEDERAQVRVLVLPYEGEDCIADWGVTPTMDEFVFNRLEEATS